MNEIELKNINETQNEYEDILVSKLLKEDSILKTINFSSPTGTGKTKMMAEVINKMSSDYFFMITTLSRGQLNTQIRKEIARHTSKNNYIVFGLNDYTKNTHLQADDILSIIPKDKKVIWFRDEGHINTNRWFEILEKLSYKIVNFSATNKYNSDDYINCNFNHTMMLRTVRQGEGEPEDALKKLIEVKYDHRDVPNYNPCAIFRILDDDILKLTLNLCLKYKLEALNITEEKYDMSEICKDDNKYDVIINKFKIVEGIDIRRAHVLYMTNEPSNPSTTIQIIGRCRRNALLYRDDIDILAPENRELLDKTRVCHVFYNVRGMNIDKDENGDLVSAFCDTISVQSIKPKIYINLDNGCLNNGLCVLEANGISGTFFVDVDKKTGFNYLSPETPFYSNYIDFKFDYIERSFVHHGKIWFSDMFKISDLLDDYNKALISRYKLISLDAKYEIDYPLSNEKNEEIFQYIENNQFESSQLRVNKKNKYPYIVEYCLLDGPVLTFDNEIDFNNLSAKKIVKMIYPIEYNYIERFKSREEAVDFIGGLNHRFPLPNDIKSSRLFKLKVHKRRYNPILSYVYDPSDKSKKYNSFKNEFFKFKRNKSDKIYSVSKGTSSINSCEVMNEEINDREIALLSGDMKILKRGNEYVWIEDKDVTSKLSKYTKFNIFITDKYKNVIEKASKVFYHQDNCIFKTKKLNSMFGYCVEYTSKLLLELFSKNITFYNIRRKISIEIKEDIVNYDFNKILELLNDKYVKAFLVKEAIKKYRSQMISVYSLPSYVIPSMTINKLIEEEIFLREVFDKSYKVFDFLISKFEITEDNINEMYFSNNSKCNLSVKHIYGLADYIIDDTIIDLKCTSSITEKNIKQVLAYYWLSQKHKLGIKKVMVYEAIKNKYILIDLENDSIDTNIE